MPLSIVWSQAALRDLQGIVAYIAMAENEVVAERMRLRTEQSVLPASEHPYMFRAGRRPGTREVIVHTNYIAVYRIMADRVRVLSVVHTRASTPDARSFPAVSTPLTHTSIPLVRH